MHVRTSLFRAFAALAGTLLVVAAAFAQPPSEKPRESVNFVMQFVEAGAAGSNLGEPADGWKKIEKQLPNDLRPSAFRKVGEFWARGAMGGGLSFSGIWSDASADTNLVGAGVNWAFDGLGGDGDKVVAEGFKMNLVLPAGMFKLPLGAPTPERWLSFSTRELAVDRNVPTLLTTFDLPGTRRKIFVVLIATPVAN